MIWKILGAATLVALIIGCEGVFAYYLRYPLDRDAGK